MCRNEILIQRHTKSRSIWHGDPAIHRLNRLVRQLMPKRRILHAILKHERIAASAQPMQARCRGYGTGIAMIAQPRANLLHAFSNVVPVCKAISREINLVHV